jgi:hypothetical protein
MEENTVPSSTEAPTSQVTSDPYAHSTDTNAATSIREAYVKAIQEAETVEAKEAPAAPVEANKEAPADAPIEAKEAAPAEDNTEAATTEGAADKTLWDAASSSIREAYKLTDEEVKNLPPSVQMVLRDVDTFVTTKMPMLTAVDKSLEGHKEWLTANNIAPEDFVGRLAKVDGYMRSPHVDIAEKAAVLKDLLTEYGLEGLAIEGGAVQFTDEDAVRATQTITNLNRQLQQAQNQLLQERFNAFSQNHEYAKHPAIQRAMVSMLNSKTAKSLEDAYEQAIWADPATRAVLVNKQKEELEQSLRAKKVEEASKVSSPAPVQGTKNTVDPSSLSRREQIAAMMRAELKNV